MTTTTSKEVLQDKHTHGEWEFDGLEVITCNGEIIADIRSCNHDGEELENQVYNRSQSEAEANAELIVKAVNNYQSLVDALRACEHSLETLSEADCFDKHDRAAMNKATRVLNSIK